MFTKALPDYLKSYYDWVGTVSSAYISVLLARPCRSLRSLTRANNQTDGRVCPSFPCRKVELDELDQVT